MQARVLAVPNALVALAVLLSLYFFLAYTLSYYTEFTRQVDQIFGVEYVYRTSLFMHIFGASIALLFGPFQFVSGLRRRYMHIHRWTGRVYLFGVAVGATASFYVAPHSPVGASFGIALWGLGVAWLATTGMAVTAVYRKRFELHKEWMIRSYVVALAFVWFRVLVDYTPLLSEFSEEERYTAMLWASWTIPLLITEVTLGLRKMSRSPESSAAGLSE